MLASVTWVIARRTCCSAIEPWQQWIHPSALAVGASAVLSMVKRGQATTAAPQSAAQRARWCTMWWFQGAADSAAVLAARAGAPRVAGRHTYVGKQWMSTVDSHGGLTGGVAPAADGADAAHAALHGPRTDVEYMYAPDTCRYTSLVSVLLTCAASTLQPRGRVGWLQPSASWEVTAANEHPCIKRFLAPQCTTR